MFGEREPGDVADSLLSVTIVCFVNVPVGVDGGVIIIFLTEGEADVDCRLVVVVVVFFVKVLLGDAGGV